ncbi:hypothetical protein NQ318_001913 [Aromia moschata]|uniref:RING-type domain-containing protein n=1 Tax=Aromia moschata TaxID=1265417 RepID=A0AAV8Z450_9CUCU|nr:hypothetical protein NQ318_001913 [Aromia moschata]
MQGSKKIPIIDINQHITCKICNGYFVDATTIIECLHTFCRSCIIKYLESNKYCPVCDVQVHKTKPLLNVRPDKTLQDVVYKLVPRLFQNEMQRRREFYENHPEAKPSSLEQCGEASYQHLLTPEETICLTLSYHGCNNTPRYLRCPAAVSVGHLEKLLRAKYDLTQNHRVEILYNQDCLSSSLTLMDIAYIYLWKRKGPIELTYRIYECTAKKPKLEPQLISDSAPLHSAPCTTVSATNTTAPTNSIANNNNNWKEVQLRISENGEMSITGIQDAPLSPSLLEIVNTDQKYKNDVVTVVESKPGPKAASFGNVAKKELPGLKYIGKSTGAVTSNSVSITTTAAKKPKTEDIVPVTAVSLNKTAESTLQEKLRLETTSGFLSLSSGTTTTVFSTINSSKCSTKSEDSTAKPEPITTDENPPVKMVDENISDKNNSRPASPKPQVNHVAEKCLKRKNEAVPEAEPPAKHPKPTILNHSIGLLNLSNNHPLKKHSKLNRNGENVKELAKNQAPEPESATPVVTTSAAAVSTSAKTSTSDVAFPKPSFINKNFPNAQLSRPGTPIMSTKPSIMSTRPSIIPPKTTPACYAGVKPPCYMPKTTYSAVINVPKPTTSSGGAQRGATELALNAGPHAKPDNRPQGAPKHDAKPSAASVGGPLYAGKPATTATSSPQQQQQQAAGANNKPGIKSKPSTPIGYKTLRDPPKSWNSQISKANLSKSPDPKYSGLKNVRPAKFFKMRNNMPRYLGNPASGVKPMYQVHISPEKDKHPQETNKVEKSEIRKHSIVKIDPKTLKPISEKAPETTSLSNHTATSNPLTASLASNSSQPDLKINTSSVSIFNPLKLQSSPKNERRSPKSPHSPKLKSQSPTGGGKRDKVNLNFTPPNPFIPNLASPTVSPNQFLYPTGPPGFPPYDPRMMAAYHSLWYGQRMGFPAASAIPGLSLDLNQRKGFEMMAPSPTSPKMGVVSQQQGQGHSSQISSKLATTSPPGISVMSRPHSLPTSSPKQAPPSKKTPKEPKNDKSLENHRRKTDAE